MGGGFEVVVADAHARISSILIVSTDPRVRLSRRTVGRRGSASRAKEWRDQHQKSTSANLLFDFIPEELNLDPYGRVLIYILFNAGLPLIQVFRNSSDLTCVHG